MDVKTIRPLAEKIGWFYMITATGVFSGFSPWASGTMGTVVAIPIYLLFFQAGWFPYLILALVLFGIGLQGANKIEEATEQQDSGIIVIDEIVGYLITMLFLPLHWFLIILGFFVFRLFDIVKPYPIRKIDENMQLRGFGVMLDDVLAGVYANIGLQIFVTLVW